MDITKIIDAVPVSALVFILVLIPVISGLLLFSLRTRLFRKGFVTLTAWILTIAACLLFFHGAVHKSAVLFDPSPVLGLTWSTLVMVADFILLAIFIVIGLMRRSALITILAVAQAVPMVWFEAKLGRETTESIVIDWLSIIMVLIVSVIGSIVAIYALPYMKEHERHLDIPEEHSHRPRFFLILMVFLGAMNGLVLANNVLWLYFFWEITTLCSFLMIGHDNTEKARTNAERALWMNLLGGVGFAVGIIFLYRGAHTIFITEVLKNQHPALQGGLSSTITLMAMACFCFAGFTKAAQMPFQSWLLGAMVAPTPVSALLHSSTMVKAGVYVIIRFAPVYYGTGLSEMVAIAGSFTFVAGAMLAIGQTNAKKVLAYSTISNLGLIIACAGLNTTLALAAAVMLIIFHAISKGLLFMATGVVEHSIWSRDIEDMQGLVSKMPLTTTLMVIGILSMLLPPFGVLIAKLTAIEASVKMPSALVLLVIGSTLTVVFWTKWTGRLLTADPKAGHPKVEHLHYMYFGPLLILTLGALLFSLAVVPVLTQLVQPAVEQYYQSAKVAGMPARSLSDSVLNVPWALIFGALTLAVVVPMLFRVNKEEIHPAYMCGEQVEMEHGVGFRSVADEVTELSMHSYYFTNVVGEQIHSRWINAVATVMVVLMFGAVYLWR